MSKLLTAVFVLLALAVAYAFYTASCEVKETYETYFKN